MSFAKGTLPASVPPVMRFLRRIEDGLMVTILSAMILLSAAQILLRNFLHSGLAWGDPLLRVLVLWIGLLGAMAATRDDKHITVDVFSRLFSGGGRTVIRLFTDGFTAIVCSLLAYHGARFVRMDYEAGVIAFASVPAWICESIVPFGFAVMAFRFLLSLLSAAQRLAAPAP